MKKALVIGANGFAGRYLRTELENSGYEFFGADVVSNGDDKIRAVDMLDTDASEQLIADIKPDFVFNLAGQASPNISWERINLTMHLNVDLSVNILSACAKHCPNSVILLIGSANQYDMEKAVDGLVGENTPLSSDSPYSVSKNTQEELVKLLSRKYNLNVILTRSFNHIGRGQREGFVITDYCARIAKLENGLIEPFNYGNLDSWRDFSDARDVVHAYRLIAEKGRSGEIYNVGSGKSFYIKDLIAHLVSLSEAASSKTTLPVYENSTESVHYRSDNSKLFADTGFEPVHDIYETLGEVLSEFREKVASGKLGTN